MKAAAGQNATTIWCAPFLCSIKHNTAYEWGSGESAFEYKAMGPVEIHAELSPSFVTLKQAFQRKRRAQTIWQKRRGLACPFAFGINKSTLWSFPVIFCRPMRDKEWEWEWETEMRLWSHTEEQRKGVSWEAKAENIQIDFFFSPIKKRHWHWCAPNQWRPNLAGSSRGHDVGSSTCTSVIKKTKSNKLHSATSAYNLVWILIS